MHRLLFFLLFVSTLMAREMELYIYWDPNEKGDELFQYKENETLSLTQMIGKRMTEGGWKIKSWDLEKFSPAVLSWGEVKNWQQLKWRLGFDLEKIDPDSLWVFWNFGHYLKRGDFSRIPKEKLVLYLWEPPTVDPSGFDPKRLEAFNKVFTWDDDLVDNVKFFKFYYPVLKQKMEGIPSFEEKKFCTMIASRLCSSYPKQLYKERENAIRYFEDKPGEFDLYGKYWEKRKFKNYRGAIPDKMEVLKQYKYCICYENTRDHKGYITEKIFDCFAAGCVPIYWGASNVEEYIPKEAFIDRRKFADEREMVDFLKGISRQEFEGYLQAAEEFIKSEKAQLFTADNFVKTFDYLAQKPSS